MSDTPIMMPRLGYTIPEASERLSMSKDSFRRHVLPHIKIVRKGKMRIVPHIELERWIEENMEPLDKKIAA